ncbi:hypothetical protein [Nocardiopsis oceani]
MAGSTGGPPGHWQGPGYGPPGHPAQLYGQQPRHPAAPPPTDRERLWKPLQGATLAMVLAGVGVAVAAGFFALIFVALFEEQPLLALVYLTVGFSLLCGVVALMWLVLKQLGVSLPFLCAVLVLAPGAGTGITSLGLLFTGPDVWGTVASRLVALVLSWLWAFLVIRWRLTRAPLLPVRLPAAVAAFVLLVALTAVVAEEAQVLWMRQTQPEELDMVILDHHEWTAASVGYRGNGRYFQRYEPSDEAENTVLLESLEDPEESIDGTCGDLLELCEVRDGLVLVTDEDTGQLIEVLMDVGEEVYRLDLNVRGNNSHPTDLVELSDHVRPSTPGDHRWLAKLVIHATDYRT